MSSAEGNASETTIDTAAAPEVTTLRQDEYRILRGSPTPEEAAAAIAAVYASRGGQAGPSATTR